MPEGDLPPGIEVRAPSPVLSPPMTPDQATVSVASFGPKSCGSAAALQLYAPQTAITGGLPRATSTVSPGLNNVPTTPWISLCVNLQREYSVPMPPLPNPTAPKTCYRKQIFSMMACLFEYSTHGSR